MMESCEYVMTAIANYLLTKDIESTQVENSKMLIVIEKFIDMIEKNLKTKCGLDEDELFVICLRGSNFRWQLNQLFEDNEHQISWEFIGRIMTYFAQVVEMLMSTNQDTYGFLVEMYNFVREHDMNTWIAKQPRQWMNIVEN